MRTRPHGAARAAVELLGGLLVVAVLLYAPFVYAATRLSAARRVPPARATQIAHSTCAQLRTFAPDADFVELLIGGPSEARAEREQQLIEERAKQLHCRRPIGTLDAD